MGFPSAEAQQASASGGSRARGLALLRRLSHGLGVAHSQSGVAGAKHGSRAKMMAAAKAEHAKGASWRKDAAAACPAGVKKRRQVFMKLSQRLQPIQISLQGSTSASADRQARMDIAAADLPSGGVPPFLTENRLPAFPDQDDEDAVSDPQRKDQIEAKKAAWDAQVAEFFAKQAAAKREHAAASTAPRLASQPSVARQQSNSFQRVSLS